MYLVYYTTQSSPTLLIHNLRLNFDLRCGGISVLWMLVVYHTMRRSLTSLTMIWDVEVSAFFECFLLYSAKQLNNWTMIWNVEVSAFFDCFLFIYFFQGSQPLHKQMSFYEYNAEQPNIFNYDLSACYSTTGSSISYAFLVPGIINLSLSLSVPL